MRTIDFPRLSTNDKRLVTTRFSNIIELGGLELSLTLDDINARGYDPKELTQAVVSHSNGEQHENDYQETPFALIGYNKGISNIVCAAFAGIIHEDFIAHGYSTVFGDGEDRLLHVLNGNIKRSKGRGGGDYIIVKNQGPSALDDYNAIRLNYYFLTELEDTAHFALASSYIGQHPHFCFAPFSVSLLEIVEGRDHLEIRELQNNYCRSKLPEGSKILPNTKEKKYYNFRKYLLRAALNDLLRKEKPILFSGKQHEELAHPHRGGKSGFIESEINKYAKENGFSVSSKPPELKSYEQRRGYTSDYAAPRDIDQYLLLLGK